ncbi:hypothetical protein ACFQ1M_12390 [Sungkyunkwania multivorans]|uniref:Lipopolysaccharide assembly protein A domain-containing protein n=1 Tax=Sungkyunkwania multivorans TaxID=1173618 RepID=A0ABW3CZN9_9FLAO
MKIFTYILIIFGLALIAFNATKIDFEAPLEGESLVAVISIVAALCGILLLLILNTSKKIQQKIKGRK